MHAAVYHLPSCAVLASRSDGGDGISAAASVGAGRGGVHRGKRHGVISHPRRWPWMMCHLPSSSPRIGGQDVWPFTETENPPGSKPWRVVMEYSRVPGLRPSSGLAASRHSGAGLLGFNPASSISPSHRECKTRRWRGPAKAAVCTAPSRPPAANPSRGRTAPTREWSVHVNGSYTRTTRTMRPPDTSLGGCTAPAPFGAVRPLGAGDQCEPPLHANGPYTQTAPTGEGPVRYLGQDRCHNPARGLSLCPAQRQPLVRQPHIGQVVPLPRRSPISRVTAIRRQLVRSGPPLGAIGTCLERRWRPRRGLGRFTGSDSHHRHGRRATPKTRDFWDDTGIRSGKVS
jgi:hypothetical protein